MKILGNLQIYWFDEFTVTYIYACEALPWREAKDTGEFWVKLFLEHFASKPGQSYIILENVMQPG